MKTLSQLTACPISKIVACMETTLLDKNESYLLQAFVTFIDNKTNKGFASMENLMNRSNLGKNTYMKARKSLEEKGIISVVKKGDSFNKQANTYFVDFSKLTDCYEGETSEVEVEIATPAEPEPTPIIQVEVEVINQDFRSWNKAQPEVDYAAIARSRLEDRYSRNRQPTPQTISSFSDLPF